MLRMEDETNGTKKFNNNKNIPTTEPTPPVIAPARNFI